QPEFIRGALRIIEEFPDHLEPIDDAIEMFKVLARQYPVYILSNFQDSPFDRLVVRHPFLREARGTVVSAKVNMMKPEPDIYHHLIGHYNLTPQETVFIDDRPENIEAAAMFGINGILFQDPAQVRRELIKLGILL
ncbi:HAD family hydrolase, partial [bacterium]|nr:HAD family hydrolase [bacterium]